MKIAAAVRLCLLLLILVWSDKARAEPQLLRTSVLSQTSVMALPSSPDAAATVQMLRNTPSRWTPLESFKKTYHWDGKQELWYRIEIQPDQLKDFPSPVLILPFVIQALSVHASGKEIYAWGEFGKDGEIGFRGYPIHMIPLAGLNLSEPLLLRVGSAAANIGVIDGVFIGDRTSNSELYFWLGLPNLALFVLALLIGSLSLFAFVAIRGSKTPLAYGLFAIVIGTFVGSHSYTLRVSPEWAKVRHSTELLSLYLSGLTFSFYLDTIFASIDTRRILNKAWKFYAFFCFAALFGEITHAAPLFKWLRTWQTTTALIFLTVPYFTIRSMLSKSIESYFVGGGLIAFSIASFAGVLFSVGGGSVTAPIFHFFIISGVFLLLVGLGGVLVYRHYDTNKRVIRYEQETALIREAQARQEKDMEAARAVQQTLLSPTLRFPECETCVHWMTADQTGGDWYAGHFDRKNKIAYLFLGDVTGHGFASALVTGLAHGAVTSVFKMYENESGSAPDEMLLRIARAVNHVVFESASRSVRAMSMICIALNSQTGELHLLNCGHPQVYRITEDHIEALVSSGPLLGFHDDPEMVVKRHTLSHGDRLFLYTDGVIENGRSAGKGISFAKLRKVLRQPEKTVDLIHNELIQMLKSTWQGAPVEDDTTFIVMQWQASRPRAAPTGQHAGGTGFSVPVQ